MDPLEKLGLFVVGKLRDSALDHANGLLAGHWKAPGVQSLQAGLSSLTTEQRELVRRCVRASVDGGIHDFLFALAEAHDFGSGIALEVDGKNAAALSDGLQGEPYGAEGWFARFSKYGPNADTA